MALALPFLSTGPKVTPHGKILRARTSLLFAICTLGLCFKTFEANAETGLITHRMQFLWFFFKTWRISFDDVKEVHYRYENLTPLHSFTAADAFDCYSILIERHDRRETLLFRWFGQGEFTNNSIWPDFFYWEDILLDVQGTQKKESLVFFEALKKMIFPRPRDPWDYFADSPYNEAGRAPAFASTAPADKPSVAPPPVPGVRTRPPGN